MRCADELGCNGAALEPKALRDLRLQATPSIRTGPPTSPSPHSAPRPAHVQGSVYKVGFPAVVCLRNFGSLRVPHSGWRRAFANDVRRRSHPALFEEPIQFDDIHAFIVLLPSHCFTATTLSSKPTREQDSNVHEVARNVGRNPLGPLNLPRISITVSPSTLDAYVPSGGPDLLPIANFTPTYIPFETLRAVPIDPIAEAASYAFAKKFSSQTIFFHVVRCFYFALALPSTGFPSGTPGVVDRIRRARPPSLPHHPPARSRLVQQHRDPQPTGLRDVLRAARRLRHVRAPADRLAQPRGNSSANQMLMFLSALFDVGGYNGTNLIGADTTKLWHPKTVVEIEKAHPRGDFAEEVIGAIDRDFTEKPNCLVPRYPGGERALEKDFHVGSIVGPENQQRRSNVRGQLIPSHAQLASCKWADGRKAEITY
ncbi:hypothetical protein R3P38DRAFT_3264250 [Favolaschia claudopus]|uniref:Uncharacterized protein n=1 Tax=Favolaschia claudopus TaxID=2862362 RepID=A0AAW0C5G8_9AGAR